MKFGTRATLTIRLRGNPDSRAKGITPIEYLTLSLKADGVQYFISHYTVGPKLMVGNGLLLY